MVNLYLLSWDPDLGLVETQSSLDYRMAQFVGKKSGAASNCCCDLGHYLLLSRELSRLKMRL